MLRACFLLPATVMFAYSQVGSQVATQRGFAIDAGRVFAWGDGAYLRASPAAKPSRIAQGTFSESGCVWDVDGDGLALPRPERDTAADGTRLYKAPKSLRASIHSIFPAPNSSNTAPSWQFTSGCRFASKELDRTWKDTELYSFYTPSREGGIRLADFDRDGRTDILVGNY